MIEEPNFLKDLNVKKKMSRSVIGNDLSSSEVFNPFESDIKEKEQLLNPTSNQLEVPGQRRLSQQEKKLYKEESQAF